MRPRLGRRAFLFALAAGDSVMLLPEIQAEPDGRHCQVDDLLVRMTLDEKIGQLNLLTPGDEVLTGPTVNTDIER